MRLRTLTPLLALAMATPAFAQHFNQNVLLNVHVGALVPQESSKIELDGLTTSGKQKSGYDVGLSLQVLHSERFSTRWGWSYASQDLDIDALPNEKFQRNYSTFYIQGLFSLVNGVGKNWYLLAGGIHQTRTIEWEGYSDEADKVRSAGFQVGTGLSFNSGAFRLAPELIYQQAGKEGSFLARVNFGF
ncbi:hypothetical protein [Holophaga foetida]|uniref:hypothetical protein n=1 Tax=Holophaga foetida TaxID=35839 RepID=UPI0002471C2E|nr:hypothetical protein [Holophaga foetida]